VRVMIVVVVMAAMLIVIPVFMVIMLLAMLMFRMVHRLSLPSLFVVIVFLHIFALLC